MRLSDFVPPIAVSGARWLLKQRVAARNDSVEQKRFRSYADAMAFCSEKGYENDEIVNVVLEKTKRYRDRIARRSEVLQVNATNAYSLCSILATLGPNEINVIDFGGACGAHYFLARAFLPPSCKLRWHVVETTNMANRAQQVFANDELTFSDAFVTAAASMERIDLVHTSGTIQCVADPCSQLAMLTSVPARYILLNRLGLTKGAESVIFIHESWLSMNGPGPMPEGVSDRLVRYPFTFPTETAIYETLTLNYDVTITFDDASGVLPVAGESIIGLGILAKRRDGGVRRV